jgi:murein DD-endopeptidase MepM/ murein hydrolase activator NlpD
VRLRPAAAALLCALFLAPSAAGSLALPTVAEEKAAERWIRPVRGILQSPFAYRWGRMHNGVDLDGHTGDPVRAALSGVVTGAGYLRSYSGYGLTVRIRHDRGIQTMYAHLSAAAVRVGHPVRGGDVIGRVGCTGSCTGDHLHFEVRAAGKLVNPLRYIEP